MSEALEFKLSRLSESLKEELAHPKSDSVIRVAAAHNELRALPQAPPSALRAECLLDIAHYFYVSGQTLLAIEPAGKAVDCARALGDQRLLRKSLTFQGVFLADTGNIPGAVECYASALELAHRTQDLLAEGSVWNNLGLALVYSAQYADAIRCFRRTLALASQEPALQPLTGPALGNIALASLHAEDFATGLRSAEAALEALGEPVSASDLLYRVSVESTFARLLLEVDGLAAAKERCDAARNYASRSHSQRAEQAAGIAEGLYEVYAGQTDIGLTRLQTALQQARLFKFSLRDALIAMVKAHDRAGKPQLALIHLRELLNVTRKTQQERALIHNRMHLESLGFDVARARSSAVAGVLGTTLNREQLVAQIALLVRQSIAAELIEDPSGEHIFRVGKLSGLLGAELGHDDDTCFMIEMSARLHDIGKIGVPEAIIAKRGVINPDQRVLLQTHASIGSELLAQSGLPHIEMAVDVARHHHEKWDGSGYPDGLAMEAIPEVARIVALVDSFDAMTHDRPCRPALSFDRALEEIKAAAGIKFDPRMTPVFIALVRRLAAAHADLDAFLGADAHESPFIRARRKIAEALQRAKDSGGLAGI
jgi:putative two-component system response regulator